MTDVTTRTTRPWLDAALPVEERIDLLLAEMTLAEKVGQTHQVANIDPEADAERIRAGRISSSLYASGATGGNERDEGVLVGNIDAAQRHAVEGSRMRQNRSREHQRSSWANVLPMPVVCIPPRTCQKRRRARPSEPWTQPPASTGPSVTIRRC